MTTTPDSLPGNPGGGKPDHTGAVGASEGTEARTPSWLDVTSEEPCVICGRSEGCKRRVDGTEVVCRFEDNGLGIKGTGRDGGVFFRYVLSEFRFCPRVKVAVDLLQQFFF